MKFKKNSFTINSKFVGYRKAREDFILQLASNIETKLNFNLIRFFLFTFRALTGKYPVSKTLNLAVYYWQ